MGNQGSHTHHGLPLRHRLDSDGPPVLPPHVSPAAVAVPAGRPRHVGGEHARLDTPGTFETPPCINIRPSNQTPSSLGFLNLCVYLFMFCLASFLPLYYWSCEQWGDMVYLSHFTFWNPCQI